MNKLIPKYLSEIIEFKNGKLANINNSGPYPVYGGNGIIGYSNNYNSENTLIIGRVGANCGSIHYEANKCWVSDNAISATPKFLKSSAYNFYLMLSIDINSIHVGTSQPLLTQEILKSLKVPVFEDLKYQIKISSFLNLVNKKIENNIKINKLLLEKIKYLFKFRFYNEKYYTNNEKKKISDFVSINKSLISSKEFNKYKINYLSIPIFDEYSTFVEVKGNTIKSDKSKLTFGDVLISKLNPKFLRTLKVDNLNNMVCSTEFIVLRAKNKNIQDFIFALMNDENFNLYCQNGAIGTSNSHKRISPNILMDYKFPYNEEIIIKYSKIIKPLVDKFNNNLKENYKLRILLDFLIPNLIAAKIQIK